MPFKAPRAERPETVAARVLRESGESDGLPVDVYSIARKKGIKIVDEPLEPELSGLLLRAENVAVIVVRSSDAKVRKRFTVAHEIGHLEMHVGRPLLVESYRSSLRFNERRTGGEMPSQSEEVQANRFAAELLMPRTRVEQIFEKVRNPSSTESSILERMANLFEVSSSAMQFRLTNLGLLFPQE